MFLYAFSFSSSISLDVCLFDKFLSKSAFGIFKNFLSIYLLIWLCWVLAVARRLALVVESRDYSSLGCADPRRGGSGVVMHGLSCSMASSGTRDQTWVPYIVRKMLNHWTTRGVPACGIFDHFHLSICIFILATLLLCTVGLLCFPSFFN